MLREDAVVEQVNKDFVAVRLTFYGLSNKPLEQENFALYKKFFVDAARVAPRFAITTVDGRILKSFGYLGPTKATRFMSYLDDALKQK